MGVTANSRIERAILTHGYDALPSDPIRDRGRVSAAFLGLRIDDFRVPRNTYAIYHTAVISIV